jgi:hypothetical protein
MTMPDPGTTMHVAAVDYAVTFSELVSAGEPVRFSAPNAIHFQFGFDTGAAEDAQKPGHWVVSWDTSWFAQAAVEASISATLDQVCGSVATLLGLTVAAVRSAVLIRRMWTMNQNSYDIIPGVTTGPQQVIIPDIMAYPPAA